MPCCISLRPSRSRVKFFTWTAALMSGAGSFRIPMSQAKEQAMSTMYVQPAANTIERIPPTMGSSDLRDESWLVARAKSGHEDAFGELYQRHQLKSYRTALRILRHQQDAEDVVQRAFQRAFVSLEAFREDSTFSTWLTRVVINEALMLLRQRRTREPLHE